MPRRRLPQNAHMPRNVYAQDGGFRVDALRRGRQYRSPLMFTVAEAVAWRDKHVDRPQEGLLCPTCGHSLFSQKRRGKPSAGPAPSNPPGAETESHG